MPVLSHLALTTANLSSSNSDRTIQVPIPHSQLDEHQKEHFDSLLSAYMRLKTRILLPLPNFAQAPPDSLAHNKHEETEVVEPYCE